MQIKTWTTKKKVEVGVLSVLLLALFTMIIFGVVEETQSNNNSSNECNHYWLEANCTSPEKCEYCGDTRGELKEHNFSEATCIHPKTCIDCGITEGGLTDHLFSGNTCINCGYSNTPVSAWGFYDIDDMGYGIVCIVEYNLTDPDNRYVVATTQMQKFEGQYCLDWSFAVSGTEIIFDETSDPNTYTIVNNDNILLGNNDSFSITDRKKVSSYENFVTLEVDKKTIWETRTYWFVPYSLIDWDRGATVYTGDLYEGQYILYLK